MSESNIWDRIDKIQNKSHDLFERVKIKISDFEASDNIRDDVKKYCIYTGCPYCVITDRCLHREMHKYIECNKDMDVDNLLDKLKSVFYLNIAPPVVGQYFLENKRMDLSDEEIDFLIYNALSVILFITSGIAGTMFDDAAHYKENSENGHREQ